MTTQTSKTAKKKTVKKKLSARDRELAALRQQLSELEEVCDELIRRQILTPDLELVTADGPVRLLPFSAEEVVE